MEMTWPKATVLRWIDGDTVELLIDRGFDDLSKKTIRLIIVNTPERKKDPVGYQAARYAVNFWAPPGAEVSVITYKHDAWRRYLGDVSVPGLGQIHQELLRTGLGTPYVKP